MNLVKDFKVNDLVKCKLNFSSEHTIWFTGKITRIIKDDNQITIRRDDTKGFWTIIINKNNKHLLQNLVGDWNK